MRRAGFLKRLPTPAAFKRFKHDENGLAMVEFAIALPFLTAMWLGTVTFADMQRASNSTNKIAATVADIVSQGTTINAAGANAAFSIVDTMFGTPSRDTVRIYVAGLKVDSENKPKVVWAYGYGDTPLPAIGSEYRVDGQDTIQIFGDFLVVAHATVTHETVFKNVIGDDQVYDYSSYTLPRSGEEIEALDN